MTNSRSNKTNNSVTSTFDGNHVILWPRAVTEPYVEATPIPRSALTQVDPKLIDRLNYEIPHLEVPLTSPASRFCADGTDAGSNYPKVAIINNRPNVNAGADKKVTLPSSVNLLGVASDDGLPAGSSLIVTWSKVSGPGVVTFVDNKAKITNASFSLPGNYVLRLSGTDGVLTDVDDVAVDVLAGGGGTVAPGKPPVPKVIGDGTNSPTISGISDPGTIIHIMVNGDEAGTTTADAKGNWTYTFVEVEPGVYDVTVAAENVGGTSDPSGSVEVNVTPESSGGGEGVTSADASGGGCGLGGISAVLLMGLGFLLNIFSAQVTKLEQRS